MFWKRKVDIMNTVLLNRLRRTDCERENQNTNRAPDSCTQIPAPVSRSGTTQQGRGRVSKHIVQLARGKLKMHSSVQLKTRLQRWKKNITDVFDVQSFTPIWLSPSSFPPGFSRTQFQLEVNLKGEGLRVWDSGNLFVKVDPRANENRESFITHRTRGNFAKRFHSKNTSLPNLTVITSIIPNNKLLAAQKKFFFFTVGRYQVPN